MRRLRGGGAVKSGFDPPLKGLFVLQLTTPELNLVLSCLLSLPASSHPLCLSLFFFLPLHLSLSHSIVSPSRSNLTPSSPPAPLHHPPSLSTLHPLSTASFSSLSLRRQQQLCTVCVQLDPSGCVLCIKLGGVTSYSTVGACVSTCVWEDGVCVCV